MTTHQKLGLAIIVVAAGRLCFACYQLNPAAFINAIAFMSTVCVGAFLLAYEDKPPH